MRVGTSRSRAENPAVRPTPAAPCETTGLVAYASSHGHHFPHVGQDRVRARPVGRIAGKVGTVRASPPHVVSRHRHRAGSGKALGRAGEASGTHPKPALGAQRGLDCDPEAVLIRLRRVLGIGAIVTPVEQGEYGHLRIGDLARGAGVPGMALILNRSTTPTPWAPVPMTRDSTPPPPRVICMRAAHAATRAQPPGPRLLPTCRRVCVDLAWVQRGDTRDSSTTSLRRVV